jgi:filamentous hemagglutinin
VIVAVVVAYFTAGAASGIGVTAGEAAAFGAGEGVALAGGGTLLTGTGELLKAVNLCVVIDPLPSYQT